MARWTVWLFRGDEKSREIRGESTTFDDKTVIEDEER